MIRGVNSKAVAPAFIGRACLCRRHLTQPSLISDGLSPSSSRFRPASLRSLPRRENAHSRTVKSTQLVLPLLFAALAPGAEAFKFPNHAHEARRRLQTTCSESACSSPDGFGGTECWAGSQWEPCTCNYGMAKLTGETTHYEVPPPRARPLARLSHASPPPLAPPHADPRRPTPPTASFATG